MKEVKTFCDCCGKPIEGNDYGSINFHFHSWGGGSMGGEEDEHDYDYQDICIDCCGKISKFLYGMGLKAKNKFRYQL